MQRLFYIGERPHTSVIPLAALCLSGGRANDEAIGSQRIESAAMPYYGPELIQTMRAVLEEVMTKIPVEQVTPAIKAHMAEFILKAAAQGQTSYNGLLASASDQIGTILSMLS